MWQGHPPQQPVYYQPGKAAEKDCNDIGLTALSSRSTPAGHRSKFLSASVFSLHAEFVSSCLSNQSTVTKLYQLSNAFCLWPWKPLQQCIWVRRWLDSTKIHSQGLLNFDHAAPHHVRVNRSVCVSWADQTLGPRKSSALLHRFWYCNCDNACDGLLWQRSTNFPDEFRPLGSFHARWIVPSRSPLQYVQSGSRNDGCWHHCRCLLQLDALRFSNKDWFHSHGR